MGLKPFSAAAGSAAFLDLLGSTDAQIAAVDLDVSTLASQFGPNVPPLLRRLAAGRTAAFDPTIVSLLTALPSKERVAHVVSLVLPCTSEPGILFHPSGEQFVGYRGSHADHEWLV